VYILGLIGLVIFAAAWFQDVLRNNTGCH